LSNGEKKYINPSKSTSANPVTSLDDIRNRGLEGPLNLVDFTNLRELDLTGNKITRLDMNNCPNLQVIRCDNNPITNLKFVNKNKFAVEIYFSQGELLKEKSELKQSKEELEKKIAGLEKEKEKLEREKNSRPDITLGKWNNVKTELETGKNTIQQLQEKNQNIFDELTKLKDEKVSLNRELGKLNDSENDHLTQITKLKSEHVAEVQRIRDEFDRELGQECNKYSLLISDKKHVEESLKIRDQELKNLNQILLEMLDQLDGSDKKLDDKQNELTNASHVHQSEIKKKEKHITYLKDENSSLEQKVNQLSEQLSNLKNQWLKKQEDELNKLIAGLKGKLNNDYQDEIDDLLKAWEELKKDSNNHLAKRQLKQSKARLVGKLKGESEIDTVLAKKGEL
jgi:chromosome segregation ATPase